MNTITSHPHASKLVDHPSTIYRRIKFLPQPVYESTVTNYSGIPELEDYIFNTKELLDKELPRICVQNHQNLSRQQQKAIKKLQRTRHSITIKPADKNLGIVILDTDDYLMQCCHILMDEKSYRLAERYPHDEIKHRIINIIIAFKKTVQNIDRKLYNFLQTSLKNTSHTPKLYGLPKMHKEFKRIPPLRPIVAQSGSILNATAKFIDHALQPLAQSYEDYIQNSTSLIVRLESLQIPESAILVTVDVENLYPSIPQTECLDIVYNQMIEKRHLLIANPNLIIRLLHICVNYNYFEFAGLVFQQTHGTAMGAAFSPTIANIFLSVVLKKFLDSYVHQPLLLVRYIDDIFIIWPNENTLNQFIQDLNFYHQNLKFTHTCSNSSVNFLDLTIYKGPHHHHSHKLDIKTYQKPQNLYQYLEFSSNHPKTVFKSLVLGECIRFVRSNTRSETFAATTMTFQRRLQERGYPKKFTSKILSRVKFSNRPNYLTRSTLQEQKKQLPIPLFKCHPPPKFDRLKQIILRSFNRVGHLVSPPRFITLTHPTLRKSLIRASVNPTLEQSFDILLRLSHLPENTPHKVNGLLPTLRTASSLIRTCNQKLCRTCNHLNCSPAFSSKVTKQIFPIRHKATCTSSNLIYLITCTKCRKQYVGMTSKQLNTRIHHHRYNILHNGPSGLASHFNFPNHDIKNLSVQVIDVVPPNCPNSLQKLQSLEHYWISQLKTLIPHGLNVSPGVHRI